MTRAFTLLAIVVLSACLLPAVAEAGVVGDVEVDRRADGYELRIHFLLPLRYQHHAPESPGRFLRIQLRTVTVQRLHRPEIERLMERQPLTWDRTTRIPLEDATYEGGDPEQPVITLSFPREVAYTVRSGAGLTSLIITVRTRPSRAVAVADSRRAKLLKQADQSLFKGDYRRAAERYGKVLNTATGETRQRAQERLGIAVALDLQHPGGQAVPKAAARAKPPRARTPAKAAQKPRPPPPAALTIRQLAALMKEADAAMKRGDYRRAAERYVKVAVVADGEVGQRARERLGAAVAQDLRSEEIQAHVSAEVPAQPAQEPVVLMGEADAAMMKGEYGQAAERYARVAAIAGGEMKQRAQERLGLAYDRSGQPDRARAEYEACLRAFPTGPDADRVRQRLLALVTATQEPQERLQKMAARTSASGGPARWEARYAGNVAQMYALDKTHLRVGGLQTNRADLTTDADVRATWSKGPYEIGSRFSGRHRGTFVPGRHDEDRIGALSLDLRDKQRRLYGRIGRQSRTAGGLLGRFDGVHASYGPLSWLTLNGVFGSPVETTKAMVVDTDRIVSGVSTDFGPFGDRWEISTFFVDQENSGVADRRAVGSEIRYFDETKSLTQLFDYDFLFGVINAMSVNGSWIFPTRTTVSANLDYRRSPSLLTENAIQGQQVSRLSELFGRFSDEELRALAKDRTAISGSATLDVAQRLSTDLQLIGETTVSGLGALDASGGLEAVSGTGTEFYHSLDLLAGNLPLRQGLTSIGLRVANTMRSYRYAVTAGSRLPLGRRLRLMPQCRLEFQRGKKSSGLDRVMIGPRLRMEYALKQWMSLELEGGIDWNNQSRFGDNEDFQETYVTAGYRLSF